METFLGIHEAQAAEAAEAAEAPEAPQGSGSQQGSWALCCCPAVGGVSEICRKADANVKPSNVTKISSQDAHSSFGSRMLLVLDLKVKIPKFVLPARPGSCRCSQDLAHGTQVVWKGV